MAITETELAVFSKTAFFDQRTWLNQENWQAYFGGSLPTGVIVDGGLQADEQYYSNALAFEAVDSDYKAFRAGKIIANGIYAEYDADTLIPVITSSEIDRLIVARVYLQSGAVKIVGKSNVAQSAGYTTMVYARMLLQDESLGCERDDTQYDIPLVYEIYGGNSYDIRRLYYLPSKQPPFLTVPYNYDDATEISDGAGVLFGKGYVDVFGGMAYDIEIASGDTSTYISINPQPICSEKVVTVFVKNNSSTNKQIRLPLMYKNLTMTYEWVDSWTTQSGISPYIYRDLVANDKIVFTMTPYTSDSSFGYVVSTKGAGGAIDPDDYFTKVETAELLADKANVTDVEEALDLKANVSDLGALALQDTADYVTQLTNKPTLGSMAFKDVVDVSSETTGILPIDHGGTGAASVDMFVNYIMDAVSDLGTSKTYYVDVVTGSDQNSGESILAPFKTIQHAIDTCTYLSNNTLYITGGTYNEAITVPFCKRITLLPYSSGATININAPQGSNAITVDGGTLKIAYDSSHYADWTIKSTKVSGATIMATNDGKITIAARSQNTFTIIHNTLSSANGNAICAEQRSYISIYGPVSLRCVDERFNPPTLYGYAVGCDLGSTIRFGSSFSISANDAMSASEGSTISLYDVNVSLSSAGKVFVSSGGLITYKSVTGTYGYLTNTNSGGRVYTGAQS